MKNHTAEDNQGGSEVQEMRKGTSQQKLADRSCVREQVLTLASKQHDPFLLDTTETKMTTKNDNKIHVFAAITE